MTRVFPARVLVLDDDETVCRKAAEWLQDGACDVLTFLQADAALTQAARVACHVAFVDLQLGAGDGTDTIRSLRTVAPTTRVVALCAFPEAAQVIAAMRAGANDLLEKPIQQAALQDALNRQLSALGLIARSERELNERLGQRLRSIRTRNSRTLADVAGQSGLTSAQLSQIELGRTATSTWTLARIAMTLRTSLRDVFAGL